MKITERKIDYCEWKDKEFSRLRKEGRKPEDIFFVSMPDIFWEYTLYIDGNVCAEITFDDIVTKVEGLKQQRLKALDYFKKNI